MSSTMQFIINESNTRGVITCDGEVIAEGINYSLLEVFKLFDGYSGCAEYIYLEPLSDKEFDDLYEFQGTDGY